MAASAVHRCHSNGLVMFFVNTCICFYLLLDANKIPEGQNEEPGLVQLTRFHAIICFLGESPLCKTSWEGCYLA